MGIIRPLAYQLRPTSITNVVGQSQLLAPGKPIYQMVATKHCQNFILYGPAGTGKTSIASSLAHDLSLPFEEFNAAIDNKKKLQTIVTKAEKNDTTVIVFVDEIHRLTKTIQDFLLPYIENGLFLLIGATTENPYISLSPAIRSRCQLFEVQSVTTNDIQKALHNAMTRQPVIDLLMNTYGINNLDNSINPLLDRIANHVHGDVRTAFNALEYVLTNGTVKGNAITFNDAVLKNALPDQIFTFDKDGDAHYNTISAFQKSIRGSDIDAALLYLARLLKSGDLDIIIRRLSIIAFEDIGVADINTVNFVTNAINVAKQTGLKEGRIPLSDAVIKLCLAPKANVGEKSIDNALAIVDNDNEQSIPANLLDTHFKNAEKLGHVGYKYPHNYPYHIVKQQYLPDNLLNEKIFIPDKNDPAEKKLLNQWNDIKHIIR